MATHTLTRATLLVCILHFISATYIVDTSRLDVSTGSGAWETRREGPVLAEGESSSSTGGDHEFSAHFSRSIQQEQDSEDTPLPQHLFKGPEAEIEAVEDLTHHSHDWAGGHDRPFTAHHSFTSDSQLSEDKDAPHGGDLQSLHQHSSEHAFHEDREDMPMSLDEERAMAERDQPQELDFQPSDTEALDMEESELAVPHAVQHADAEGTSAVDPQTEKLVDLQGQKDDEELAAMQPTKENIESMLPKDESEALDAAKDVPSQTDTATHPELLEVPSHTPEAAEEQHLEAAADAIDALTANTQEATTADAATAAVPQHPEDQTPTEPSAPGDAPVQAVAEPENSGEPQLETAAVPAEQDAVAAADENTQLSESGDDSAAQEVQPDVGPGLHVPLEEQSVSEEPSSLEKPQGEGEQQGATLPDTEASVDGEEAAAAGPIDVPQDVLSVGSNNVANEGDAPLPAEGQVSEEQREVAAQEGVQPGGDETSQQHADEPPHPEELQMPSDDANAGAAPEHHDAYDTQEIRMDSQVHGPPTISEQASHDANVQKIGEEVIDHHTEPTATEEKAEEVDVPQEDVAQEGAPADLPESADTTAADTVTPSLTEQQLEVVSNEATAEVEGGGVTTQETAGGEEQQLDSDVSGAAAAAKEAAEEESAVNTPENPDDIVNLAGSGQGETFAEQDLPGAEHLQESVIPTEDDSDDTGNHTAVALELALPPSKPQNPGNHRAILCAAVFMLLGCVVCYNLYVSSTRGLDHKHAEALRTWCYSIPGAQSLLLAVHQWSSGQRQAPFSAIYNSASTPLLVMDYCNNSTPNKARGKRDTSFSGNDTNGEGAWASSRADLEAGSRGSYARTSRAPSKGSY